VVKCSGVLQCSDGFNNKVSNIIRKLMDNMKLLLICILLLSHHHHHVQEELGLIPVPCILEMKLVPIITFFHIL